MSIQVVFLDKDGTLIEDVPFNIQLERIKIVEGAIEALRHLAEAGFKFVVISNQSGIAHGLFEEREILRVRYYLEGILKENGITLLDFYYCPHHPDGSVKRYKKDCLCRKPSPGMIWKARNDHHINLSKSWFIGDILDDVECGRRAKCKTVLINNNHETKWELSPLRVPDAIVGNFCEAADFILQKVKHEHLEPL